MEKTGASANRGNIQTDGQDKIVEETIKQSMHSQLSSEHNEGTNLLKGNPQSEQKILTKAKSDVKSFKKIKSENYATLADDGEDYFESKGEEVFRDDGIT